MDSVNSSLNMSSSTLNQASANPITDAFSEDPWKIQNNSTNNASSILDDVALPTSYASYFSTAQPNPDNKITVAALDKIIFASGLPKATSNKILYTVLGMNQTHISRGEFFVILALIALAQKNMDFSLESLKLYKNDLPEPSFSGLESIDFRSLRGQRKARGSFSDPWRASKVSSLGFGNFKGNDTIRSRADSQTSAGGSVRRHVNFDLPPTEDDIVEVSESPELGGILFKYVNYAVTSSVRDCTVLRRYSDFYWLWETLHKRYPYRMLPSLPPKKFGGSKAFFDERLLGLSRFVNFLVVHPTIKEDSLVNAFLTEPTDLSTYRKENPVHSFEELEFSENNNLPAPISVAELRLRISKAKQVIDQATRQHDKICSSLERMRARQKVSSKDYLAFSQAINSLADQELPADDDCYPCTQIFSQFGEVSNYVQKVSTLMEDSTDTPFPEVIEGFRRHHMLLAALQELLVRIESFDDKELDAIRDRITQNQTLLETQSSSGSDTDLIKQSIATDEQQLENLEKRHQFMNHCLSQEMDYFHSRHALTRELYKKFITMELDSSSQISRIWKQLSQVVDAFPAVAPHPSGSFTSHAAPSPSTSLQLDSHP